MSNSIVSRVVVCIAVILSPVFAEAGAATSREAPQLGFTFIENEGQWPAPVRFVASAGASVARIEPQQIVVRRADDEVALTFEGANATTAIEGEEQRRAHYNFFIGDDPSRWCSRVPTYASVIYRDVWNGIDVRVRGDSQRLAYDLLIDPGASLESVSIRVDGAIDSSIASDGTLILHTFNGSLRQTKPVTWEVLPDGSRRHLDSRFRRIDSHRFAFEVAERNDDLPLVIDPGLEWSTFLGGGDREEMSGGVAVAPDGSGDIIVAGKTWSLDFPSTNGVGRGASPLIPFVARFNSSGTTLIYATLFGSRNGNVAHLHDMTLDANGGAVLVGETNGADFPTTAGAYDTTFNEPQAQINRGWDAFITRFDPTGSQMIFSTFLGAAPIFDPNRAGSMRGGEEAATAVAVDANDAVIVAGWTRSEDFPTTAGAYDRTLDPIEVDVTLNGVPGVMESRVDAFVARFNPTGTQLLYSTYIGGQADDLFRDLVVDAAGNVTLVGVQAPIELPDGNGGRQQHGRPFPTTADALVRTHLGASDAIIARMRLDGAGAADLKYATIFGGTYIDEAGGVALDPNNSERITLSGWSRSWDFPTTPGAWQRAPVFMSDGNPYYFGFLARFLFPATGGGALGWSTIIESVGAQIAHDVDIDPSGDVVAVGLSEGPFPTSDRAYKRYPSGVLLTRFSNDGRQLLFSTFLHRGSTLFNDFLHLAALGSRQVAIAGSTLQTDFPTTPGAFDRIFGSDGTTDGFHRMDGFVAKMTLEPNPSADTTAAAPALINPANNASAAMDSFGSATVLFDWSDVADPSGIEVYEINISRNPEFLLGFGFQMPGYVTQSQYEWWFNSNEIVYWRVRALDRAGNFSAWSETRKLTIGGTPNWTNFVAVEITPNALIGGGTAQGRIFIHNFAQPGGITYTLTSSNPAALSVPPGVTVPAGSNTATFTITTHGVTRPTPVQISVWAEGNGDHPVVWVDPAPPGVIVLSSLSVTSTQGVVTLNGPAPEGGAIVSLASSNPSVASVPSTATVGSGLSSATFAITTSSVTTTSSVDITASYGGATRVATLTVNPPAPPPVPAAPSLVSPANDAKPPQPITFDWTDVANAVSYTIQIDDSDTFSAPQVVSQSVTASQVTIGSLPSRRLWWRVRGVNSAGVAGNWSSVRRVEPQASTTQPPPPSPAALSSLTFSPTSVTGGTSSQGTVTLSATAPSGGAVVSLTSANAVVSVPSSVTVAAGTTSVRFTATTSAVSTTTNVSVTAAYNGVTRSATLSVNAPSTTTTAAPSLVSPSHDARFAPGQTITFDWSDVSGAASYTIQIDDSDSFSSPIVSPTVTASQYSTSSLPVRTMWWRVRAISSSGAAGPWSSVRRVEVKD